MEHLLLLSQNTLIKQSVSRSDNQGPTGKNKCRMWGFNNDSKFYKSSVIAENSGIKLHYY